MTLNNKNSKTITTIVLSAIVLTLVIPMIESKMAEAQPIGRNIVYDKPSDSQIPLQQDLRSELLAKLKVADSDSSKKEIESKLGNIDASVQQWFKTHTDPQKEKIGHEKQEILVNALISEENTYGFQNRAQHLPWSSISYDYVNNALEVTILPQYFNTSELPNYFAKIRSIVGDQIDISLSPKAYAEHTSCSGRTSPCNPLTGGIQYGPSGCTTGYAATISSSGWTGFVTAGHCVLGAGSITQPVGGSVIGQQRVDSYYQLSTCDCAFVSATIPIDNNIFGYSPTPNNTAPPFNGMSVTESGVGTNGLSSGSVTNTSVAVTYQDGITLNGMVRASYVSIAGDSGAPVASGTAIIGIQSGHDNNSSPSYFSKESNVRSNISGLAWKFTYPP